MFLKSIPIFHSYFHIPLQFNCITCVYKRAANSIEVTHHEKYFIIPSSYFNDHLSPYSTILFKITFLLQKIHTIFPDHERAVYGWPAAVFYLHFHNSRRISSWRNFSIRMLRVGNLWKSLVSWMYSSLPPHNHHCHSSHYHNGCHHTPSCDAHNCSSTQTWVHHKTRNRGPKMWLCPRALDRIWLNHSIAPT